MSDEYNGVCLVGGIRVGTYIFCHILRRYIFKLNRNQNEGVSPPAQAMFALLCNADKPFTCCNYFIVLHFTLPESERLDERGEVRDQCTLFCNRNEHNRCWLGIVKMNWFFNLLKWNKTILNAEENSKMINLKFYRGLYQVVPLCTF